MVTLNGKSKFVNPEWVERAILRTKAHDILCILKVAGIHPNGNSYASSAIIKAIQDVTLHKPDIVCNKDTNGNIYLFEVHLCFEYNGRVVQDCKGLARACEGKNPIFPATPRLTVAPLLDEELNLKIDQGVEANKTIDIVAANKK
ncbi:Ribonuclease [Quillaja saponaria]|uniref:Ribonuclease n=1 Tax=Quillaja saponaria TaxID=32244 RepID=A0AAD7Q4B5_QUISA|nr:Ribonuclease [Quillaja saponaria]